MKQEPIVIGANTQYPLQGLLTLPDCAEEPVPAVVFVHGSGSSNLDEKVGKLTPFKDLAEGLANHGIASIRYDKRSFAHGWKMLKDPSLTITAKEETIEDAILATELLRQDPRIDSENLFIVGHSMGGMLAPRIDAEGGNYKGLVLMAGTPRKLEEVLEEQGRAMLDSMGKWMRRLTEKRLMQFYGEFQGLYELSDEAAKKKKMGGGTTLYYFKEMGEHPTPEYLKKLQKPLLVLQGEKDVQVRADRDFVLYKKLLKGNPQATFRLYKGLNHAFVPAVYGTVAKMRKEFSVEQHIGEPVIADIANWIKQVSQ